MIEKNKKIVFVKMDKVKGNNFVFGQGSVCDINYKLDVNYRFSYFRSKCKWFCNMT